MDQRLIQIKLKLLIGQNEKQINQSEAFTGLNAAHASGVVRGTFEVHLVFFGKAQLTLKLKEETPIECL